MDIKACIDPKITMLKLSDLSPDNEQPRDYFDFDKLDELKASIEANGIITPLLYRIDKDKNIIVSGEYRYKAATALKLAEVPAQLVLRDYQVVALSENMQRNSLTAMEEARGLQRLIKSGMDRKQLMEKFGRAENTISEMLKPTELPDAMQEEALKSAFWSRSNLLKLAKIEDKKAQKAEFEKMKAVIDKKEAAKERKRQERLTGEKVKVERELPRDAAKSSDKKITVLKTHVTKLHDRVKKELDKGWQSKDKNKLKKDLQELVATINKFLSEQPDEKGQPEKKAE